MMKRRTFFGTLVAILVSSVAALRAKSTESSILWSGKEDIVDPTLSSDLSLPHPINQIVTGVQVFPDLIEVQTNRKFTSSEAYQIKQDWDSQREYDNPDRRNMHIISLTDIEPPIEVIRESECKSVCKDVTVITCAPSSNDAVDCWTDIPLCEDQV